MKLFRKNQERADASRVAEKIAGFILERQYRIAVFLNQKLEKVPQKTIKTYVISCSSACGAYCLYLIFKAFN